ncbi:hypothetical protein NQZ79_g831 [Umbelopsis isabellina]|nr:hypothetical protein NQZ79_g831 [Umbelopsis isabellina]
MSDNERTGPAVDDELSLPKATVQKLISEMMPGDIVCAKDTRDLLIDCCVEFIHLIASEANEICEKETKKTIAGEHVIASLQALGFEDYVEEVDEVYKEHKKQQKVGYILSNIIQRHRIRSDDILFLRQDRDKRSTRLENSGISEEELLRQQELLFEKSRLKFEAQNQ